MRAGRGVGRPGASLLCLALSWLGACASEEHPSPYQLRIDLTPEIRALGGEDDLVAEEAHAVLACLGPRARPALLAALSEEGSAGRREAIGLLADLSGAADDSELIGALSGAAGEDPDGEVRAAALLALAGVSPDVSRPLVVAGLASGDPAVRAAAVNSCNAVCRDAASFAALADVATDGADVGLALQARRVLQLVGEGDDPARREAAARAAREASRSRLEAGASGVDATLAALVLADAGDERGLAALERALQSHQPPLVRIHAVYALGRLGNEEQIASLKAVLEDRAIAYYAHDALRRLAARGVPGAEDALDGYEGPRSADPLPPPYVF